MAYGVVKQSRARRRADCADTPRQDRRRVNTIYGHRNGLWSTLIGQEPTTQTESDEIRNYLADRQRERRRAAKEEWVPGCRAERGIGCARQYKIGTHRVR